MKDSILLLIAAFAGAILAILVLSATGVEERWVKTNEILTECQRELPRNQVCELIAVPKQLTEVKP